MIFKLQSECIGYVHSFPVEDITQKDSISNHPGISHKLFFRLIMNRFATKIG
jgi:hypothetical protein